MLDKNADVAATKQILARPKAMALTGYDLTEALESAPAEKAALILSFADSNEKKIAYSDLGRRLHNSDAKALKVILDHCVKKGLAIDDLFDEMELRQPLHKDRDALAVLLDHPITKDSNVQTEFKYANNEGMQEILSHPVARNAISAENLRDKLSQRNDVNADTAKMMLAHPEAIKLTKRDLSRILKIKGIDADVDTMRRVSDHPQAPDLTNFTKDLAIELRNADALATEQILARPKAVALTGYDLTEALESASAEKAALILSFADGNEKKITYSDLGRRLHNSDAKALKVILDHCAKKGLAIDDLFDEMELRQPLHKDRDALAVLLDHPITKDSNVQTEFKYANNEGMQEILSHPVARNAISAKNLRDKLSQRNDVNADTAKMMLAHPEASKLAKRDLDRINARLKAPDLTGRVLKSEVGILPSRHVVGGAVVAERGIVSEGIKR